MKKQSALLLICSFLLSVQLWAQERTIRGTVISADDQTPLPGVSVRIAENESVGTITDIDGKYELKVGSDATALIFSFVGFERKKVAIGAENTINVSLRTSSLDLNEVVVTANAIVREKKELGYAVTTIDGEETTKARDANVLNTMAGKVPGVRVTSQSGSLGGGAKIIIRGATSLSGNNQPLFVVDGNPLSNSGFNGTRNDIITGGVDVGNRAADINPDDIESISVLKGAAATVLYGSRAKNGAIIITTKSGKSLKGSGKKTAVTLNSSVRFDNPLRLPDFQNEYAQGDQGNYDAQNFANGWGPKINGQRVLDWKGDSTNLRAYPDNVKNFYETGATYINSVSLSQGDENGDFRFGYTNLSQSGIIPNSSLERNTFTINSGRQLTEKLHMQVAGSYINTVTEGNARQGGNNPSTTIALINGLPRTISQEELQNNVVDEFGNPYGLDGNRTINNPYWVTAHNNTLNDVDRFYGNATLNYKFSDNVSATYRLANDFYSDVRENVMRKGTLGRVNGEYEVRDIFYNSINSELMLNVSKQLNEDFKFDGLFGHNVNQRSVNSTRIQGADLLAKDLYTYANAQSISNTSDSELRRLYGLFAQLRFGYKDYLFLELTGRNDWSSTLPVDNRSYFYPGASASFMFSEILPESTKEWLFSGKLRANIAAVGSDEDPYRLNFFFTPLSDAFTQFVPNLLYPHNGRPAFAATNTIPNANLKPQRQITKEFGTELIFFGGRLRTDINYYNIQTKDQIVQLTVPQSTGFNLKTVNAGTIQNEGIEILLSGIPVQLDNGFTWTSTFNFGSNKQIVKELAPGLEEYTLTSGFSGLQIKAEEGEEFGLYGGGYVRSPNGDVVIDETTGLRQFESGVRLGDIYPDWTLGINNEFSYKGVTASFLIDIRKGGVIYSNTVQDLRFSGLAAETAENGRADFVDEGVNVVRDGSGAITGYKPNETSVSAQDYWQQISNNSLAEPSTYAADFVKLRELKIGYNLPKRWIANSPFASVSIGIEGRNLWLIDSEVPHIDPEVNFFGTSLTGEGVEFASVPSTRTIGFNLRVTL
ncbi:SusC/RagA family TonB-linked outer membrane protein [Luteibaculum oceani]|uniref:SusC/RagA family TonB-linked outer membrane protein n=1 Tax=Luteibaculum oceani TaxID=1294296 RepID=A0A5C6UZK2_9FLAO|nr:SusC/RagA family TonB-linked outer membrane protein [Luteibaculum oceani]TXC78863.1 SusC/RagA family TonB-linked outer membrane protein [Luteibaculum oceani]